MPVLSAGMESAILTRWLKREGDEVEKGEVIAEIETHKATMELEATEAGKLGRLLIEAGVEVPVDTTVALLLRDGQSLPSDLLAPAAKPVTAGLPQVAHQEIVPTSPSADADPNRPRSSPLARRLAAQYGIDLSRLSGSGPHGRIVRIDVERSRVEMAPSEDGKELEALAPAAPDLTEPRGLETRPDVVRVPHTAMRRTIARRLTEAKRIIPHFYLEVDCEMDALLALRAEINAGRDAAGRISVNDFVVKSAALALRRVPAANAIWTDEAMLMPETIDISVAVATDGGLITPIVRRADEKSIGVVSREIRELAARAQENRLKPEEYQGGSFSVSNLGMHGVNRFAAIVNPPQSCILAVGTANRRPICRGDEIVSATMMSCTLSIDHRAVDGALGAQVLAAFKNLIENPLTILS